MLFGETVAVYFENHTEHTNTLCGQNAEFCFIKAGGTYSDHWALKAEVKFHLRRVSRTRVYCAFIVGSRYLFYPASPLDQ
jgi:hypothetical protein